MVGPGEVDDDLQPEVVEECAKYGEVIKVIIYEVGLTPSSSKGVVIIHNQSESCILIT